MNTKGSLARRLTLGAGLWSAVLLLAGALILTTQYRDAIHRVADEGFGAVLDSLAVYAETNAAGEVSLSRRPGDPRFERAFSGQYWQISKLTDNGLVIVHRSRSLFDAELNVNADILEQANHNRGVGFEQDLFGPIDEPMRSMTKAFQLADQETILIISAAADRRPADKEISKFRLAVAGVLGMFGIGLLIGIFLQIRYGLRPLYKMEREIADVREGEKEQLQGPYPKELVSLAKELNTLLRHNKEIVVRARTHVGNLAHALKTPISVLLNESEKDQSQISNLVHRQASNMAQQVDHHLRRASAATRAQTLGARTSVNKSVENLCRTMTRLFAHTGVEIRYEVTGELHFRGEEQDLDELLGNLLENACKWAEKRVHLSASVLGENRLQILVEDDGPGLSVKQRKAAIKRGERLDEAAPGSGLGLSIVNDLARAYGGTLSLAESSMGGLCAKLDLPASKRKTGA
ncbi:Sensor histidine kinase [hydrothermal vent metagenome]|uniref:histidine kinase n=1 Tax=hydrothermal vent metagenome TaxID=652676 RepID=A0A3B0SFK8_9ZZZZ